MKRVTGILTIMVLIGAIAIPVLAHGPGWGGGGPKGGFRNWCPGYGAYSDKGYGGGLTGEQRTQLDSLYKKYDDETAQIRKDLWTKSGDLNSLLNTSDPDTEKAKALQKEINDLRAELGQKRLDFELEANKIAPNSGFGRGYSRSWGGRMGGYGGPMRGWGHHMGGCGHMNW